MRTIINKTARLTLNEENLHISVEKDGEIWNWVDNFAPKLICAEGEVRFQDFEEITHELVENGIGRGILSRYTGFVKKHAEQRRVSTDTGQTGNAKHTECTEQTGNAKHTEYAGQTGNAKHTECTGQTGNAKRTEHIEQTECVKHTEYNEDSSRISYAFATYVWIETATEHVFFEWIPLNEEGLSVQRVLWPGPMAFEAARSDWYTLLNVQQGLLVPNDWETELGAIAFDGFFGTAGSYMPWFAQVRERSGYIALCTTPWNAGYQAEHPANGPYTQVGVRFEPSLGKMEYRRVMRYTFLRDCDYNDLCKVYRRYVQEQGSLVTLAQKTAKTPQVEELIGRSFVHTGIKTQVQPDSDFFDPEAPEKNNHLTPFSVREEQIGRLHELGAERLYLHLDGWAQPGYDNCHPHYLPACQEAGGWEGMKSLADHLREWGDLFGIHDQYRDFYLASPDYREDYACRLADGTIPMHKRWAGGPQSYLCATQVLHYVQRNFSEIAANGVRLDGAYLDVFTCNEGDECSNPMHRMTRRECCEYRNRCFEYLLANGILPSSEEVSDWSLGSLVFCHYAPYEFMMRRPGAPKRGIPVPLFNLVYHDCVIVPWMMEHAAGAEDYMLYALLNGGAPYLVRDAAYPGTDGAFEENDCASEDAGDIGNDGRLKESIDRCRIVSELHRRVAKCELVRHELLEGGQVQRSLFADGTQVTADFRDNTFRIEPEL